MSGMKSNDQRGNVDIWLVGFFVVLVLFFGTLGFGIWAFSGRQNYKNNVDGLIADAVAQAEQATSDRKDKEFVEKEKEPYRDYISPSAYGSVDIKYPKTWSAYVDESGRGNIPVDGYFNPATVPGTTTNANYAIRTQVINTQYAQNIKQFDSALKNGKVKISPYSAPKVSSVVGIRVEGEIANAKQGSMIILPMRDKTLRVWTESVQFVGDLDKIVLANLVFVP